MSQDKNGSVTKLGLVNQDRIDRLEEITLDLSKDVSSHGTALSNIGSKLDNISNKVDNVVVQVAVLINEKTKISENKGLLIILAAAVLGALSEVIFHVWLK
jgi:hypothetical protein